MPELLDPKNDYVFKRLFADEPALLGALINAVRQDAPPVTRLLVRNPTIDAEELRGKYIILDILAEDASGGQYNIEMQVRRHQAVSARSIYYLARIVSGQLVLGDDYGSLQPVVGIHLLDFDLFTAPAQAGQACWNFQMRDARTPEVTLGPELQLYLVELRKADRLQPTDPALAPWIALFKHWQEEDRMAQIAEEPVRAAYDKLKAISSDERARWLAFQRERALLEERSLLNDARKEGRKEGREEGLEKGREEGLAQARRETARNLLRLNSLDDAAIAAATGLTPDAVRALREG